MTVSAVKCYKCGDIIYSRHVHDFHWCTCQSVAIDGGRDYTKLVGQPSEMRMLTLDIGNLTNKDLVDDWNLRINKLGTIQWKDQDESKITYMDKITRPVLQADFINDGDGI